MAFTLEHKTFMIESYFRNGQKIDGQWQYSIPDTWTEFKEQFPNNIVDYANFCNALKRSVGQFRETGSLQRKPGTGRTKNKRTPENIENVRAIMDEVPITSVRHLQQQVDLSYGTCRTILKKDLGLFAYRLQCVQELHHGDFPIRREYCEWFLNTFDDELLEKTFFTDEAWFHLSGYVNSQNMRMWNQEKPPFYVEAPLHAQKIGVWAAISRRRIIGPFFFNGNLTAIRYLEEILGPFIRELHDDELAFGFFQQDGATAHTAQITIATLREFFDQRVIGRNTEHIWPPRSCDLTPADFFLWPHLKNTIYCTPVNDLEVLGNRITEKINEINNNEVMLNNVIDAVRRRVLLCLQENGEHFQHLL
ncbi:uncharacterized protein LOC135134425 [Zophobas morio]|uniref:uncharacterized protein LOC135134425 n=1 Tax=Zophobas morio TaxID=2755281 RepID=UPI00308334A8